MSFNDLRQSQLPDSLAEFTRLSPTVVSTASGQNWQTSNFPYPYRPADGRESLITDSALYRLLRGGSFGDKVSQLRCCARRCCTPEHADEGWGFRIARTMS